MQIYDYNYKVKKHISHRKIIGGFGKSMMILGIILALVSTGSTNLTFLDTALLGIFGCILTLLGSTVVKFIDYVNDRYPLRCHYIHEECFNSNKNIK